jgi:ABC-type uncharacterized transport system permease subunit
MNGLLSGFFDGVHDFLSGIGKFMALLLFGGRVLRDKKSYAGVGGAVVGAIWASVLVARTGNDYTIVLSAVLSGLLIGMIFGFFIRAVDCKIKKWLESIDPK